MTKTRTETKQAKRTRQYILTIDRRDENFGFVVKEEKYLIMGVRNRDEAWEAIYDEVKAPEEKDTCRLDFNNPDRPVYIDRSYTIIDCR